MKHLSSAAVALLLLAATAAPAWAQSGGAQPPRGRLVRVIVELNEPFTPEGRLAAPAAAAQRQRIARAEARVRSGRAGAQVRASRPFTTIPFASMLVDAAGLSALASDPLVLSVEPDRLARPTLVESVASIRADVTARAGYGGAGWQVAVIDTGIDRSHPFLGGRIAFEACFSTTDATLGSTSLCRGGVPQEEAPGAAGPCVGVQGCDHGTHVAGIAAGSGSGVSGTAPAAGLMALQVFSRFDTPDICGPDVVPCLRSYTSDQIAALERIYLLRGAYRIAAVNLSFGDGQYASTAACDQQNPARKAAIDNLRSVNIATVAASGNDGFVDALNAPACISSVISVGSTSDTPGTTPTVNAYSNSASFLSLLAPGSSVASSVPGGGFDIKSGTSMAAPHVAGAWAIMRSLDPAASVASILGTLQSTGLSVSDQHPYRPAARGYVKPLVQLDAAVGRVVTPASSCAFTISPRTAQVGQAATTVSVSITTASHCSWSASSLASFIQFADVTHRGGPGTLVFQVTANTGSQSRQGTASIAGQTFTVTQAAVPAAPAASATPDVNRDGHADLVWQNRRDGYIAAWLMNDLHLMSSDLFSPGRVSDTNWRIAATADMDGDGGLDLIWQEESQGWIGIWRMNGLSLVSSLAISIERVPDTNWKIVAARDFNADGKADIVWQHRTQGYIALWYMNGVTVVDSVLFSPGQITDVDWQIEAAADFTGDGQPDLLWRHQRQGTLQVWVMNGLTRTAVRNLSPGRVADVNWRIAAVADINRDGQSDLVWQDIVNGWIGVWLMNGTTLLQSTAFTPERVADTNWRIVGPK